jgi:AbrB family looped-hinge helix DNA binding protein
MPTTTLTSKGQTTIPREVREFLKLKSGDRLEFKLNPDGNTVTLKAANIDVLTLRGMLKRKEMKPYNPDERTLARKARARKR